MNLQRCSIAILVTLLTCPAWSDPIDPAGGRNEPVADAASSETPIVPMAPESTGYGASTTTQDVGFHGWGLRAGVASDVDQVLGGAHFNMGEFVPRLRFQPDVQLGAGDDYTTLYATAPVYYRFGAGTRFTPYAGGGVSVGFVDRDRPAAGSADDSEFEMGGKLTGGLEWPRPAGQAFFVEMSLGVGDVHDATLLAAWSF